MNKGIVFAVFSYEACNKDELSFENGQALSVLRKGDNQEKEWWWAKREKHEGYIPRNLLGVSGTSRFLKPFTFRLLPFH